MCAADQHGNTAAQATDIALDSVVAGALCPAAAVDYFTLTAPESGLLFVDTIGGVNLRRTLWQDAVVLAAGPTRGALQDGRLGALVAASPVVLDLQAQGGATGAYGVVVIFVRGRVENPAGNSFQSGLGVLSGWVCEAAEVTIMFATAGGEVVEIEAAYGTERGDTAEVCVGAANGFGLLFNWNLLDAGEHAVVAYAEGEAFGWATVRVTTVGAGAEEEFVRGRGGLCHPRLSPAGGDDQPGVAAELAEFCDYRE